ncbi:MULTISPECIES: carbohydrate ABC transporter permease [Oscillospiraceae]|uniref:Carbohydrate ABC transporter membrane protein 1 (CUT1 family) n=1 Tax=Harryflintia acetispora TaxID=1849041 RepID=A0A9X8Y7J0_9FIRM|nr:MULTISPECIES: sugar ABC transporter permease [Oscillospiraceae]RGB70047.1 sugar ABC transporter permease [Harryflintia acetispora]TCL42327.1 carbohydrate ABC transporter membrane protein 1 (CUT1 family) [Harryflintia acetispora]
MAATTLKRRKKISLIPYLFIAPNMILFLTFMIVPLFYTIYISLTKWNILGTPVFIGLENYQKLLTSKVFWRSVWNTVYYTLGTVPTSMVLALGLAVILNKRIPFRVFFRSALFIPVVISMVVTGILWSWIFNADYGILNYLLSLLGLDPVGWLIEPATAMIPIIVATLWFRVGYNMIIYLSALQGLSPSFYEAARVDGANGWQQFCYITLPLLRNTHVFVLIMSMIYSFKSFDIIYVMTGGGPAKATTTMVQYIYELGFQTGEMGRASAVGVLLLLFMVAFTLLQLRGEEGAK